MSNYFIGSDIIGADPATIKLPAITVEARPPFLQRDAFWGMKIWQAGLTGVGASLMIGGLITLIAKKRK